MSTRDAASASPPPSPGGAAGDAFDMLKSLWGMAGISGASAAEGPMAQMARGVPPMMPNLLVPTFDVAELDKRITDLRAVEQWLQLNAGMLRATIQALEVQRTTVAAMQQFGETMLGGKAPAKGSGERSSPAPATTPTPAAATPTRASTSAGGNAVPSTPLDPTAWWNSLQQQFSQIAAATAASAAAAAAATPRSASKSPRKRASKT